jgi:3-hydroxyacyl-CoA dehydrogenase
MGKEDQVVPADKVQSERRGGVLVLSVNNPPMAALSSDVRLSLSREIARAADDETICGVVITGTEGRFATGAGVSETADSDAPDLGELCDQIEALEKPVAAAIEGSALGGGLELALATHMRVATPDARLGCPEITVGLVPNAGCTQRLPKVIGGVAALKMLMTGRALNGATGQKIGLIDVVEKTDVVGVAVSRVERLAASAGELRRSSTRRDRLGEGTAFLEAVAGHRKAAEESPLDAPMRLIECVEAALLLPFEIGRGLEQAAFEDLAGSEHSRSLRHVFAAERQLQAATRWEGRVPSRSLNGVALVGARGIGSELAVLCMDAGLEVTIAEESDESLDDGVTRIIEHYDARVAAGLLSEDGVEAVLDRMHPVCGYRTLSEADFVIDPSRTPTRKRIAALDASMRAGAILAVSAERVDVGTVGAGTGRPADVIGIRFYPNLRKNRAVELAASENTGPRAIATARAMLRKLDRLIVETGAGPHAIGTRLEEALHAAADLCLEEGGRIGQIDAALRDWGLPYGSFALRDLQGLSRTSGPRAARGQRGGGYDEALILAGRTGVGAGRGYYAYRQRGKPGVEDPDVMALVEADRVSKSLRPRVMTDGEIRMRCVAAMAGAGAQLLADGIAKRPADIDMIAIHGMGFARRTGGVMYAADLMDLAQVRQILLDLSQVTSRIAPPTPMFLDLIKAGKGFSDLN